MSTVRFLPTEARSVALLLIMALAVFLSAELSRQLSADISNMSAVWPPVGIAVGWALVMGRSVYPLYGVTLWCWFLYAGYAPVFSLVLAGFEAIIVFAVVVTLRRVSVQAELLSTLAGTLRFYLFGCLMVLLPFSIVLTFLFRSLGYFQSFFFADVMLVYWLAEALGIMLFAPLAQQLCHRLLEKPALPQIRRGHLVYSVLLVGLLAFNYALMTNGQYLYGKVLTYFYFPLMVYAALNQQRWLASVSIAVIGVVVPALVVMARSTLEDPGFALLEAVLVVFLMTVMTQLVQAVSGERRGLLRRFEVQSQRDMVTGLANDRGLLNRIEKRRARGTPGAERLVVVELRDYEETHDLLDPEFSVRLEQYVAGVIRATLPDAPLVARLGVGQFGFYWCGNDTQAFERLIRAVVEALDGHVYSESGALYRMYIKVGCVEMDASDSPAAALPAARQLAGMAGSGRDYPVNQYALSDPLLQGRRARLHMLEELKEALSSDRLVLFAQEIQPATGSDASGLSFEVLVRMRASDGRIVMPGEFLPVAEDYGLMGDVDRWVVQAVFQWAARCPDQVRAIAKCSINLSGMTLTDPGFLDWLRGICADSPLAPQSVCFEVTETQMIDDWEQAGKLLEGLRGDGFSVSLDDFGTGLATFEYLTRFPFDFVKIDGRFVTNVLDSAIDQSIIRSVTSVAATMSLQTIAEFVTDDQVRARVADLGVDFVQGYAVARPIPLAELMLRSNAVGAAISPQTGGVGVDA